MLDNSSLQNALNHAENFLNGLELRPVNPTAQIAELRRRLNVPLQEGGRPDVQVIDEMVADIQDGLMASTGGRFFGWVIGGALPVAVAADWLTSVWDQNAAASGCSPAMAVLEEVCGAWLLELLGLPRTASFGFVTGCQAAHVTAFVAARHSLLEQRGWDVEKKGLSGAPAIRLITSESRHESIIRAVRMLGLGTDAVQLVNCDQSGSISLTALEEALSTDPIRPTVVCLQAGDLNTGAYDAFLEAIPLAKQNGAWVHIDGAFGLWAAVSKKHQHLLAGVDKADSWATDGHKWLNLPFDSGFVFVANPAAHSASLTQPTSYSIPVEGLRNPLDWNPEWSRRARVFPVYAALRSLGRGGIESIINRSCDHAARLVAEIGKLEGVETLSFPIINQGLLRFVSQSGDHDSKTDAVITKIQEQGEVWFGGTTWRGQRAMRVSVCNWRTTEADVDVAIDAVRSALTKVGAYS